MSNFSNEPVRPLNMVAIPNKPWAMSQTHITQAQWDEIMGGIDAPANVQKVWREVRDRWPTKGPNVPVTNISWTEAMICAAWITIQTGQVFTLPTAAQWEFAATGGTGVAPEPIEDYAVFNRSEIQPVATLKPNAFGLYDAFGNAWVWCADGPED